MAITEQELLRKIEAGETIESPEEMTEEYRRHLINLMLMQADSELSGAYGYVPWIIKAPTINEKLIVAQIVKDEVRHAKAMYKLLADLGVDVEEHIRSQDLALRVDDPDADLGTGRLTPDKRVNIFYYPIETWTDFVMFNFCMDRGAGHQLEDAKQSSYGPWARTIQGIFKEEMMHVHHGEVWVKRLAEDPATRDETQEAFTKWYLRTLNIFGRPNSPKNKLYRKYGLKRRDNDEVRRAFIAEVKPLAESWGLRVPEWTPPWEEAKQVQPA